MRLALRGIKPSTLLRFAPLVAVLAAAMPSGAVCEVNEANGTFDFHVPDAGFAIATIEVFSSGDPINNVWVKDEAGPFACP